jgi:hypothetical protein
MAPSHSGTRRPEIRKGAIQRIWAICEAGNQCSAPFNGFTEHAPEPNPETKKKQVVWFALNDDRPLTAFASIWTEFKGDRGAKIQAGPRPSPSLPLLDDGAECRCRAHPLQSHAGDFNDR